MSNAWLRTNSGNLPPDVPTTFTTDVRDNSLTSPGTAKPDSNNLEILGRDTTQNNDNGIRTDADPNDGKFLYVELTNRLHGSAQTVGVGTADIITFTPQVIGTYSMEFRVAAYNTTPSDGLGAGYSIFGAIRFDGTDSNICDPFDSIDNEEGTMSSTGIDVFVPGGPSVILRATGYALQTINWSAVGIYTFVGV